MFLKKSTAKINGKTYDNYKIVESYREGGKVKHRILFNLGHLTDDQANRMRLAINAHSNPDIVVSKADDIVVKKHTAYMDVATLYELWQEWKFDTFFPQDRWVAAMIFNRCIDPVSKINVKDWMSKTVLPAYFDTNPLQVDAYDVYRELDRLSKRESELQSFIYQQLRSKRPDWSDAFFYDITSTYMEGSRCVLATLGYSRDHRPDCEQVVIALMVTPEGHPFYWRVLEGNTQDITTVQDIIKEVKTHYGIKQCTLVFDRGMVSTKNLMNLEDEELAYVSAMDRDEIANAVFFNEALPEPATPDDWEQVMDMREFIPFNENGFLYFREFNSENRRYILTFDVARFLDEHKLQLRKLKQIIDWVEHKNQTLATAKKARSKDILEREIQGLLKRKRVNKFITIQIKPYDHMVTSKTGKQRTVQSFRLLYTANEAHLLNEQRLHGITCFITNLPKESSSAREVIQWYRRKNKVEEAFHELKDHLELRPIYLSREKRVKAHISICMLAYFLYNDIERRLRESGTSRSPEEVLKLMAECQINWMEFKGTNQTRLSITEPSVIQREILESLGCESVIDPRQVKRLLKKVENWM